MSEREDPIKYAAKHLIFRINALVDCTYTENEVLLTDEINAHAGIKELCDVFRQNLQRDDWWQFLGEDTIDATVKGIAIAAIVINDSILLQGQAEQK